MNTVQSLGCCGYSFAFCSSLQDINRDVHENLKVHEHDKRNHMLSYEMRDYTSHILQ